MQNKEPKTIWIINQYASTPETGMGGRHYYLAKELARQGHKVYLIAANYTHILRSPVHMKKKFHIENIEGFRFVWVHVSPYSHAHSKLRVWNWFRFSWKLLSLPKVIEINPDVILASSPSPFVFLGAKRLAKKYNAKLIFEVRDIWPLTLVELGGISRNHPFVRFMQWVEDKAYRESDLVISNLPNAVEHMVSRGMDKTKFHWIPNGFDMCDVSKAALLPDDIINAIPKEKFIVGYAGTQGLANALDSFIDAAKILSKYKSIAMVLVGGGKEHANLKEKCKILGLDNVYFVDPISKSQIQSMLNLFDVCYIGLTKDPLFRFGVSPNKLFEYFYAGKPILYAIDSGKYLPVDEAKAGISIPAEDPEAIADAVLKLKQLLQNERDDMGERGYRYVIEKHEYSRLAKDLSNLMFPDVC